MSHAYSKKSGDVARTALLATIAEAAPLAIVVADACGRVIFANAGAQALFGYTQDELLAVTVEALVPAARREAHRALRESFLREACMQITRRQRRRIAAHRRLDRYAIGIASLVGRGRGHGQARSRRRSPMRSARDRC